MCAGPQALARMDLADPWTRAVLLAAAVMRDGGAGGGPQLGQRSGSQERPWPLGALLLGARGGPPLVAVQQLLIKGLFHPPTQAATLQARACTALRTAPCC